MCWYRDSCHQLPATSDQLPAALAAAVPGAAGRPALAAAARAAASRAALRALRAAGSARQRQRGQRKQRRCDQSNDFRFHGKTPLSVKRNGRARTHTSGRAEMPHDTLRGLNAQIVFETKDRSLIAKPERQLAHRGRRPARLGCRLHRHDNRRLALIGPSLLNFRFLGNLLRALCARAAFPVAVLRTARHVTLAVHRRRDGCRPGGHSRYPNRGERQRQQSVRPM